MQEEIGKTNNMPSNLAISWQMQSKFIQVFLLAFSEFKYNSYFILISFIKKLESQYSRFFLFLASNFNIF